jgi:ubiquinone/menaquinone biosynthesis C-methylase UbiE
MMLNPTAFDTLAADYDADFSHTRLGQMLRQRVWAIFHRYFRPGQHLLELACGTGEDALWLAQQGLTITATDSSPHMLAITQHKAQQAGLTHQITTHPLPLQSLLSPPLSPLASRPFDGLYSNFGGLNTLNNWSQLAEQLAQWVRPGGNIILVPMGPVCLWEIAWYLLHGHIKLAMRRFKQPATAVIGQSYIPIWYPSAHRLRRDFAPWFTHLHTESLGLWLPPSYLGHFVEKRPSLFHRLNQLEKATAPLSRGWGDHYIMVLKRKT